MGRALNVLKMGKFISNPPDSAALMESARSFGNYDLPSAISDLIDNSITAKATEVDVNCRWNEGVPEVRVLDNGHGMSASELKNAMRPASRSPLEKRDPDDLGRFGLGLKTASFSQARCLTVLSSNGNGPCGARWDLDSIKNWSMEILSKSDIGDLLSEGKTNRAMTEVIWSKLDRLTENGAITEDLFNALIDGTRKQISLIFHRMIGAKRSRNKLVIRVNGLEIKPHDPFHEGHSATQELQTETIDVKGGRIKVTPFILPHYSKIDTNEFEALAGEEGYLRNQGFYVYRNHRLIMHGTWFKLVRHGDLAKLARIRVDIPNTLDAEWKITVDKSDAQIPSVLRVRLRELINKIRDSSARVYRNRGSRIGRKDSVSVWNRKAVRGQIRYSVNKDHPLILQFSKKIGSVDVKVFDDVLSLISQAFPVDSIHADMSDRPTEVVQIDTNPDTIKKMALQFAVAYTSEGGTVSEVLKMLENAEPFKSSFELVKTHLSENGVSDD